MEENQESKTLTQKVREREEQEKLAKRKVLKKIFIVVLILLLFWPIPKAPPLFWTVWNFNTPGIKASNGTCRRIW